jgi:hypothetical protein
MGADAGWSDKYHLVADRADALELDGHLIADPDTAGALRPNSGNASAVGAGTLVVAHAEDRAGAVFRQRPIDRGHRAIEVIVP